MVVLFGVFDGVADELADEMTDVAFEGAGFVFVDDAKRATGFEDAFDFSDGGVIGEPVEGGEAGEEIE